MKIKNNHIVSVLVCAALFLASCDKDEMADSNHSQKQELHTVSVNFSMPGDKPGFGEGTASRALEAEADSTPTIQLEFAEQGISRAEGQAFATTTPWEYGDVMLAHIVATNGTTSTEGKLTLVYTALPVQPAEEGNDESNGTGTGSEASTGYWTLIKDQSYTKYGDAFVKYNADDVLPLFVEDTENGNWAIGQSLTMRVDETVGVPTEVTVTYIYAPDMEWNADANLVQVSGKNVTTAPEKWMFEGTAETPAWSAIARLRVNTGTRNAGDVVTLTSSAFDSACEVEPTVGEGENKKTVFTAVTDDYGDAYFYGITDGTLDGSEGKDFIVQLTQMRVPVPVQQSGDEEESNTYSRSIALDDANFIITLDEPITLLEASDLVPVTLAADNAYKLLVETKRTNAKKENLCVIDGLCEDLDLITKQIKTALAAGITEFKVINGLAGFTATANTAKTVVGQAIMAFNNNDEYNSGTIFIELDNAIQSVPENAFFNCWALAGITTTAETIGASAFCSCKKLTSITTAATSIGYNAFYDCTALQEVNLTAASGINIGASAFQLANNSTGQLTSLVLNNVVSIGNNAFNNRKELTSITTAATSIGNNAFYDCTALQEVKLTATTATTIGSQAFSYNKSTGAEYNNTLTTVTLPAAPTSIGNNAFQDRKGFTTVTNMEYVTSIGDGAFRDTGLSGDVNLRDVTSIGFNAFLGTGIEKVTISTADASSTTVTLGDNAFQDCASLKEVALYNVTSLGENVFNNCSSLEKFTLNKEVSSVSVIAFYNSNTTNCDLTLHADQLKQTGNLTVSISDGQLKWAGKQWQSITLSDGTKYTIVDGVPTVEVDGTIGGKTSIVADDVTAMKSKIQVVADAAATTEVPANVIVKNGLAAYTKENATPTDIYAGTVVGEAIRLLTPELQPMGAETVNYNGRITLTLDNATELPQIAFAYCNALQNVSAPKATEIGPGAFISCTALTSVSLPVATTIGVYAFSDVTLANLEIGANAATDITLGEQAFTGSTINGYVKFHKVVTGDGITQKNAFSEVTTSGLDLYLAAEQPAEQITVENGQLMWAGKQWQSITVGDKVYTQETGFVKLTIGGTETYAVIDGMCGKKEGHEANDVTAVKIQIEAAVEDEINDFYVVNQLGTYEKTVMIEHPYMGSISQKVNTSVVGEAITAYANENVSITLADATTVPESAFEGCTALSGINLNNATSIGNSAFSECTALSGINLNNATSIGESAFNGCTALTDINLDNATSIGESAFNGCTALTDINLDKVASIGDDAFRNCTALTSVTTAATQIGNSAFNGCTNLQSATFTSDNTEIGPYAFSGCTNLTTLSWNKVTSIGGYAFSECEALENVSSSTVTTVGDFAFRNCTFKTVSLPEVTTLGNGVFRSCASLTKLTLGNVTSVDLGEYTHSFKEFNTAGCDLTLGAGQGEFSNDKISNGIWAGMQWKSITVGGEQKYPSAN